MRANNTPSNDDFRKTKAQLIAELEQWRNAEMASDAIPSDHSADFSAAQLAAILRVADDAIISMDEDFRIRMFNDGAARVFGFTPEEVIGQSIDMLLPEEVREIHRRHVNKFATNKTASRLMNQRSDVFGLRKNGDIFTAEASISRMAVGGKNYFTVILRDISARKRAEEELRASQRLLQTVVDTIPHTLAIKDLELRYISVNKAFLDVYGLTLEDVQGKTALEIKGRPEEDRIKVYDNDLQILSGDEESIVFDHSRINKYGEVMRMENIRSKIRDENGEVAGLCALAQDITERKRAEERLKESEGRLRSVLDHSPSAVLLKDLDGRFTLVNREYTEQRGYAAEELIGKVADDVLPKDVARGFAEQEREVVKSGSVIEREHMVPFSDGTLHRVLSTKFPVLDHEGIITGVGTIATDITERKRAEEELRASQRLLQTVFDTIPHGVFVKDRERRYVIVNSSFAANLGRKPEEVAGLLYENVSSSPVEQRQIGHDTDDQVLNEGVAVDVAESTITIADGRIKIRRLIKVPIKDDAGNVTGLVGVSEDITERKQAEAALRDSEERFRGVIDHSPSEIHLKDLDGRYTLVNRVFAQRTGYSVEEILGKTAREVFQDDAAELVAEQEQEVFESGDVVQNEHEYVFNDGVPHTMLVTKFPVMNREKRITSVATIATDITARKQAEAALRDSEERFRSVIDHSPSVIHLKDLDGRYTMVNRVFALRTGYSNEEILGKTARDIFPKDAADRVAEQEQEVFESGDVVQFEREHALNDGVPRTVLVTKFPVLNRERRITSVATIATDITARKQAEAALRESEARLRESQKMEAVGQLAGGIAHEFNNMLQVVINCAQFLKGELGDSEKEQNLVDTILRSSLRSANLTRQLLAFSRKSVIQPATLKLDELISKDMAMLTQVIRENILIEFQTIENLWRVKVDPGMMEQVIINLCINARDAMHDGGRITIRTENLSADESYCERNGLNGPGEYVMVTLSDNGAGMTPEVVGRIFEPFFTTKVVGEGTGLGLAMVQGAVQQQDGVITVASEFGVGSTFTIYLPRSDAPNAPEERPSAKIEGGNELVLLAEDEGDVLNILAQSLTSKGYGVITAQDGEEALAIFKENAERVKLVILDMVMPKMNGRKVYEKIRGLGSEVPVLFSSGYSADADDFAFLKDNGIPLIQKPYALKELFSAVREALDN